MLDTAYGIHRWVEFRRVPFRSYAVLGGHGYARLGTYAFTAVVRNTAGTVSTAARGTASVTDLDVSLTAGSITARSEERRVGSVWKTEGGWCDGRVHTERMLGVW